MKLTNYIRDAFISAAMEDVPRVEYDDQIRSAAMKAALSLLPAKVQAIHKDAALREHLCETYLHIQSIGSITVRGLLNDEQRKLVNDACAELIKLNREQQGRLQALRSRLRQVAYGCSTRKALAEALPEFAKYLPPDQEKVASLPAVANVVADFVKAGWPKNGKKPAARAA